MARLVKHYQLPSVTATPGLRPMTAEDAEPVLNLLNNFLRKYELAPVFENVHEVSHWLLPKEGVLWSYVVEVREFARVVHVYWRTLPIPFFSF